MGWALIFDLPAFSKVPLGCLGLIACGGISYTIGAIVYIVKKPNWFKTFGFHELFHIFVMIGSAFHFLAVIIYIFNEPINSSFKMAWIVPVLVIPVFGVLLYIFVQMQFQTKLMARRLEKKHRRHGCLPEAGPGSTGANQGSQQEKQPSD